MERLSTRKKRGSINGNALRTWGLLFLAAGVAGRGVIQTHMLGIGQVTAQQLLAVISSSQEAMMLATCSLVLQAIETCALPIFALMLVEGVQHTSDMKAYVLRVAGLAALCELPYNLAMSGKLFALDSRNSVFGLVLCMVMLLFFRYYSEKKFTNTLIKVVVAVAAIVWCEMLKIEFGSAMVLVTAVLWAFRGNPMYRNFAGAAAAIVCTAFSPFFLASPMGFMAVHFYDGEPGTNSRAVNYLAYPTMLLAAGLVGLVL